MITVYALMEGRVVEQPFSGGEPLPAGVVWVDLLRPDDRERRTVEALIGVGLPTREEMREIEASSQVYTENDAIYVTATVIARADTPRPEQGELTFVLTRNHMVTLRFTEPRSVATFAARAGRQADLLRTPEDALLGLLDVVIDRVADVLELVGGRIDGLSARIFADKLEALKESGPSRRSGQLQTVLQDVGRAGDLVHKVRDSLVSLDRGVTFLVTMAPGRLLKEHKAMLKTLARDLRSLNEHVGFLAHEVNFLLDATLGLINIEQNNIIKIFSVMAVVFLPPTLIASIFGMNFHHMPELEWDWGYWMALSMMLVSAIVPLWYFKRRGWL